MRQRAYQQCQRDEGRSHREHGDTVALPTLKRDRQRRAGRHQQLTMQRAPHHHDGGLATQTIGAAVGTTDDVHIHRGPGALAA